MPVELYSNGQSAGGGVVPIYASAVSAPQAFEPGGVQPVAAAPVELFSEGYRIGTQSNPLSIVCGSCGGGMSQAQADGRYVQSSGGTMTGPLNMSGNGQTFTVGAWSDQTGDTLTIEAALGLYSSNTVIYDGGGHTPQIALKALGNQVNALTMGFDPTNSFSGWVVIAPSPVVASGGTAYPQGAPLIQVDAASAPASNASCTPGTIEYVGSYGYRCISSGKWGRFALQTGY